MSFDTLVHGRTAETTTPRGAQVDELEQNLRRIESDFIIDASRLKQIVARFQEELEDGLQRDEQNIPMNVTWVMGWPTGQETGSYLTLDLGGTNLRVCWNELHGREHDVDVTQDQYKISDDIKSGNAEQLWSYIADCLAKFIDKHELGSSNKEPIPFGFKFSYPASQQYVDHGILQTWTKGLDISGVEGEDVAAQLKQALKKRDLPIRLVALINDTTGAMIASSYHDSETRIGAIFGTGCNAAYMEDVGSIPKLKRTDLPADGQMAINCEYGAFDNGHHILPRNKYDLQIDEASPRPGEQTFEKLSAGHYMGEMFRLAILDLYEQGLLFTGQDGDKIKEPYVLDTGFLSLIEDDDSSERAETRQAFQKQLDINISDDELNLARRLAEVIATRGARLCSCGVAAICRKKGITSGHIAADGSVANKHPKFKARWAQAMAEVLDWPEDRKEDPITITSAEDGSGIGAAIIAAMTDARAKRGDVVGIQDINTRGLSQANT
ncbi:Hexokinase [Cercospora beticola]|uniref:Phosphotransferase n=1 Tax=Cercospora beticola TaxID=122368 RepID=A0A2G5HL04_CERBT|nr:Hexokinase [Cercospora beticola]PIA93195.1 Hexokinase [Cercospora beticola]WPB02309.1 hypothetical protein RHO25_006943 [Cercospora beticola]